jgi:hypothetical protein
MLIKNAFLLSTLLLQLYAQAQNVGIGTTNPTASLMISTATNPQFQVRQTVANDFARVRMQTGSTRFWDVAAFNGATLPADRLNFFNSSAGDILTLAGNGFVGIGNTNPTAPLSFAASLGKKIILYDGANGDAGFGIAGNRLQIFSDNNAADVAIGYESAGVFNERLAIKPTGALAINGNTGSLNQILTSGGSGSPQWQPINNFVKPAVMPEVTYLIPTNIPNDIPNASFQITVPQSGKLVIWANTTSSLICSNPLDACTWVWQLKTFLNNSEMNTWFIQPQTQVTQPDYSQTVGPLVLNVAAGTHTIKFREALISIIAPPTIRVSAYAQFIAD